jgi:hypothetical protein
MDLEQITFRSSPVTLVSAPPRIGDIAPNFVATTAGGEPLQWADEHKGRVAIVGSLPSILLPECAAQIQVLDRNMPQFSGDDQIPLWLVTCGVLPPDLACSVTANPGRDAPVASRTRGSCLERRSPGRGNSPSGQ